MEKLTNRQFESEYHERVLMCHIFSMDKQSTDRASMYYFNNSQYELATRLAKFLMDDPDKISDFLKVFPISTADQIRINDALLHESLPDYPPAGWLTKLLREIPTERSSIIK